MIISLMRSDNIKIDIKYVSWLEESLQGLSLKIEPVSYNPP